MRDKNIFLKIILFLGDVVVIYSSLLLTLALRYGDFSFLPGPQTKVFLFHFSFISVFWILVLYLLDFYQIPPLKKVFDFFRNLLIFVFLAGSLGTLYFYLRPDVLIAPKIILFLHVVFSALFIYLWRYLFSLILRHQNFREKIIVIGFRPGLEELADEAVLNRLGYRVLAFFSPDPVFLKKLSSFESLAKHGVVSDINKLKEIIEKEKAELVVFPRFLAQNEQIIEQIFLNLPLNLNYVSFADFYENISSKVAIDAVNEAWFLENLSRAEKKAEQTVKRIFDIIFSFIGFLIFLFLLPFIALLIKIDSSGPIFYNQKRVGKNGQIFIIHKLRTMEEKAEKDGPQWAKPNDPRITRVGRVLRKTYLDEFPQFYNILRGDISFVGPRPERPEFVERLKQEIPYYDLRHLIKPGFTGWAQINYRYGASIEETKEKLKYDFYYIKNRNFFLDLGIILKTIRIILN